jgi:hypothetical protein
MASSGMLCRVALVRTNVSEELSASSIRVTRFVELEITLAVTTNRSTLRRNNSYCQYWSYLADSCHPDDGGDTFLRNVGSYKRHMA